MRPKAGDPPRTMTQKILLGHAAAPAGASDASREPVRVDQVLLSRHARLALEAAAGVSGSPPELAVAYDAACLEESDGPFAELAARGAVVVRPGAGFPAAVHLERFAAPARLCVTDEPRAAGLGGASMLALRLEAADVGRALADGTARIARPRTVQLSMSGRLRPLCSARDVALELARLRVAGVVRGVAARAACPVVLELTGPAVRAFSVPERAVVCSMAPVLGAAAALFPSDERTEEFLRVQRRSKAQRVLSVDPGAPCDDAVAVALSAVEPLAMDEDGAVHAVRELAGRRVSQIVLGGDSGATLRDLFTVAALLESKRVNAAVEFLLAVPSRQALEALASSGALARFVEAGARLVEPDARLGDGAAYLPRRDGASLRTADPPDAPDAPRFVVASAETLAWAAITGTLGDPRGFKRPPRVMMPRELPTGDVLIARR